MKKMAESCGKMVLPNSAGMGVRKVIKKIRCLHFYVCFVVPIFMSFFFSSFFFLSFLRDAEV